MSSEPTKPRAKILGHYQHASVIGEKAMLTRMYEYLGEVLVVHIPKRFIQESLGVTMKVDKEYDIQVRVIGVCVFRCRHFESEKSVQSPGVLLYLGKKGPGRPIPNERYAVAIDSVNERREFKIQSEKRVLIIEKPSMISLGLKNGVGNGKNEIVELGIRSLSRPCSTGTRYFIPSIPGADRITVQSQRLGDRGDSVKVETAITIGLPEFVNDFEIHRPQNLRNVNMEIAGGCISMFVDGRKVTLRNPCLTAYGLRARLTAVLGHTNRRILFYFDGERIDPRLGAHHRIRLMKATEFELEINYQHTANYFHWFILPFDSIDSEELGNSIVLASVPRREEESYHFRVNPEFRMRLATKLDRLYDIQGKYSYRKEKGFDSEMIQNHLLSLIPGWKMIAVHPYGMGGPDALYRLSTTNELYYFEFKWGNVRPGSGSNQIRNYIHEYPKYEGETVKGGYVGVLDWDTRIADMFLYVRRVNILPGRVAQ